MWMRSATSNTWGMLWLISTIGSPRRFTSSISSSTVRDSFTPKRRGRLVHDHHPAAEGGGAHHGDALALAAGERLHRLADVLDGEQAQRVQVLPRLLLHRGAVERAEQAAEEALLARTRGRGTGCPRSTAPATRRDAGRRSRSRPGARPSASGNGSACRRDGSRHGRA